MTKRKTCAGSDDVHPLVYCAGVLLVLRFCSADQETILASLKITEKSTDVVVGNDDSCRLTRAAAQKHSYNTERLAIPNERIEGVRVQRLVFALRLYSKAETHCTMLHS